MKTLKKKLVALVAIVIAAIGVALLYIPVQDVKAYCPNGCLTDCGDGCECDGWHPNLKEKDWSQTELQQR